MKISRRSAAIAIVLALSAATASAAERTAVLAVANATCLLCGPIVKGTLERVAGVTTVIVEEADEFSGAVATVQYDDAITNVDTLIAATTNAGYPSELLQ